VTKTNLAPEAGAFPSLVKAASPIILALEKCDPELRKEALELFSQVHAGGLDEEQLLATAALLADILFPNADENGYPGLDLEAAEKSSVLVNPEAKSVLERMDREEAVFAERLRALMEAKGVTQAELAAKLGIGQPAVSMMLNRDCRPQRKTVCRFAEALGVSPEDLWPTSQG
jgi:lambda repressor-like predicted transcriptional regulator